MVEPKLDEPAPKEGKKPKAAAQKPQPTTPAPIDPYLVFIDSSQIVVPDDLAAYRKGDEGMITVFVDVRGRSSLNCSLYLSNKILDKMEEARKKPVNLKLP